MLDQIGIVLDGDVPSAPETNGALTSGSFQITGPQPNGFSEAEATQLPNVLKFGSLPLTFSQQSAARSPRRSATPRLTRGCWRASSAWSWS